MKLTQSTAVALPSPRLVSLACFGTWALLTAIQFELVPFARYAWAFNFWRYLPDWVGAVLAGTSFGLCFAPIRSAVAHCASRLHARSEAIPRFVLGGLVFLAMCSVLWMFRERSLYADSYLLIASARGNWQFVFPDLGATYMLRLVLQLAAALSLNELAAAQFMMCACGALTVLLLRGAAGYLVPTPRIAPILVLFVLSGGIIRVFAGRIEVYGTLLPAVAAYLWLALAFTERRCGWFAPCLALGVAVWVHLAALCLIPSLVILPLAARSKTPSLKWWPHALSGVAVAAVPSIVFLVLLFASGHQDDLSRAWNKAMEILGQSADPNATRWWVRGWGGAPSIGTDYVLFSWSHLKYLANASHVLAPVALPVALTFLIFAPRRLIATPAARFLTAVCVPLIMYACVLRPFWGPFDWDLFGITAMCLAVLSAHLLATGLSGSVFRHVAIWLISLQLLFVGIPFLAIRDTRARDAGPFAGRGYHGDILKPATPPPAEIAPWL